MKLLKTKSLFIALALTASTIAMPEAVSADELYVTDIALSEDSVINYATGVSKEMSDPDYWADLAYTNPDAVLMSAAEIDAINALSLSTTATYMNDLENMDEAYNADSLRSSLSNGFIMDKPLYDREVMIDKDAYFGKLKDAILNTGFTGTRNVIYAICTKGTAIKDWPTNDIIGDEINDTDDELQSSSLTVNDPFVVKQKAVIDGHTFYWGYSNVVSGWVDGDDIALCADKAEWLDAWKVINGNKDFLVVTQDKIVLEPSLFAPYSSEVKLKFSTILKLVPKNEIPEAVAERGTWNNYVVYLPTRNSEGNYEKKLALISEHCSVSIGYLPMTQRNILKVAFSCLGNRYGWGGMLDSMDCSAYTRNVYRCFGFELPRNTTWQQQIPGTKTDLTPMNDANKQAFLETMPAGTLLYFRGHTMIYLGSKDHTSYVISALGTAVESVGEPNKVLSIQTVTINPLTVRRGDGVKWLTHMASAVAFSIPKPDDDPQQIVPNQPKLIAAYNGAKGIGVKFEKSEGATSYDIWRKYKGVWVRIDNVPADSPSLQVSGNTLMYTDTSVKDKYGEGYIYSVAAKNGDLTSDYSKAGIPAYRLTNPKLTKITANGQGKVTVYWSKTACQNYEIQYAPANDTSTWTKLPLVKYGSTSTVVSGLKKGQKYAFRIRCEKTNKDRGTTWSQYSPWLSVTVK